MLGGKSNERVRIGEEAIACLRRSDVATGTAARAPRPARHAAHEALLLDVRLDFNHPLRKLGLAPPRLVAAFSQDRKAPAGSLWP